MNAGVLEIEVAFFEASRVAWLEHYEGKWVLVLGKKLEGSYDTFDAAYTAGIEKFGNRPMLIKRVMKKEDEIQNNNLTYDMGLIGACL